ncbi:hypothetical protein FBU30_006099 [Linnemannia zychae]|nr:hypothetical protein FBU30_006099 [Linnemannia zychae]
MPMTEESLTANNNNNNKRVSEYEFPTAIKVNLPYQSYLNHPYHQQPNNNSINSPQPHSQFQKPKAYISKYNSYTNSSKTMRLITIPSTTAALSAIEKAMGGRLNDELNSPTSPLVSPPPPYLHSEPFEFKFSSGSDKKKPQQRQSVQWPSMMQISTTGATTATVTRPKLARMPPQAIPILSGNSAADEEGFIKAANPHLSKMEYGDSETLYNLRMSDDHYHHSVIGTTSSACATMIHPFDDNTVSYPTFWEDARQTKMHWAFLSFGCALLGSAIWVLVMQVFIIEWAIVMPTATLGLLSLQFGRYRWKRYKHINQQKRQHNEQQQAAAAAAAACMQSNSVKSFVTLQCDPDAFLEPHQPRGYYQSYQQQQQQAGQHVTSQETPPSSLTAEQLQQFNQQQYKQPRHSPSVKKPSQQQQKHPLTVNPHLYRTSAITTITTAGTKNQVNNGSPYYQNPQFLSPVDSPQTPPPAYFLKKIELPEIDSVGDLVSEFECDLGAIQPAHQLLDFYCDTTMLASHVLRFRTGLILATSTVSPARATTAAATTTTKAASKSRHILKSIYAAERAEGMGATVRRSLGTIQQHHDDPFLLLDEFWVGSRGGFPDHPHRGFETVTYLFKGRIQHEDFAGHKGVIGSGDLQWMTAGRGVMHCEMPVSEFTDVSKNTGQIGPKSGSGSEAGNAILNPSQDPEATHGLQLWVNLSKADKQCAPAYQDLRDDQIPRAHPKDGVEVKVIAGEAHGIKSNIYTRTPTMYLDYRMQPHQTIEQAVPKDYSGFVYMLSGKAFFGGESGQEHVSTTNDDYIDKDNKKVSDLSRNHAVVNTTPDQPVKGLPHQALILSRDDETDHLRIETKDQEAHFVILLGKPLNEPIAMDRLFVMNTKEEVQQALQDFREKKDGFEKASEWRSTIAPKGFRLKF